LNNDQQAEQYNDVSRYSRDRLSRADIEFAVNKNPGDEEPADLAGKIKESYKKRSVVNDRPGSDSCLSKREYREIEQVFESAPPLLKFFQVYLRLDLK
jgi:hypothetical protein